MKSTTSHVNQMPETNHTSAERVSLFDRVRWAVRLFLGIRTHDLRAARTYIRVVYKGQFWLTKWIRFVWWSLRQMLVTIPNAMPGITIPPQVSRKPHWLDSSNPLANHPWCNQSDATLPKSVDTVVIGAGFTGASVAYHWSRRAATDRTLVVLDMGDAADGASGRNQGTIVMGRYFTMVRDTVLNHLPNVRPNLSAQEHRHLAEQFSACYCQASYRNADMIEQTIRDEKFDVDYARNGWVQERLADQQEALSESVRDGHRHGFTDWIAIDPQRAHQESGMNVEHPSGFSQKSATWHPAKWVWSLLTTAMRKPHVQFFSHTRVESVNDTNAPGGYIIRTNRGEIHARHVIYGVESYLPKIDSRFHNIIQPHQEQLASGQGAPDAMPSDNSITGQFFFGARRDNTLLVGSDSTRVPDRLAGGNKPSRFLTQFALSEYKRLYGSYRFTLTNEWSGTVGYTPDEFPLIGPLDDKGKYMIGGMAGSGSGIAFNAARCIVNRILGNTDEPDDYPVAYFGPSRLLEPGNHPWPKIEMPNE